MQWFLRISWWVLLAIATLFAASGLVDLTTGATWQAVDITGSTTAQIEARSSAGAELVDFAVRTHGVGVIALSVVLGVVLLAAYRKSHLWAWWTMWTLPVYAIANALHMWVFGAWGPATTATQVGMVAALMLLLGAPRFFRRSERHQPDARPARDRSIRSRSRRPIDTEAPAGWS